MNAPMNSMASLIRAVVHYWIDGKLDNTYTEQLIPLFTMARENGYRWPALELAASQ